VRLIKVIATVVDETQLGYCLCRGRNPRQPKITQDNPLGLISLTLGYLKHCKTYN